MIDFMRFRLRFIFIISFFLFLLYVIFVYFSDKENPESENPKFIKSRSKPKPKPKFLPSESDFAAEDLGDNPTESTIDGENQVAIDKESGVNYNVHTFYYPWFGNPTFDNGSYYHWNHNILPGPGRVGPIVTRRYKPPDDIGSNFYPKLGCYSARDPAVVGQHFEWIRSAGIGTVVVSWYPPGQSTDQGHPWDDLMPALLDTAHRYQLKIAFHIEPYKDRNVDNLRYYFSYILKKYGSHPAFYMHQRRPGSKKAKPLFYVYDSYQISDIHWRTLLLPGGSNSIRGTELDSYIIGLLVQQHEKTTMPSAGFDGYYTYFAANGFSFGATWKHWKPLSHTAKRTNMIFIPCVGTGYIDESVRPWNKQNTHARGAHGEYYAESWQSAVSARVNMVGVTSFNEWHEGTQIEPAVPHTSSTRTYLDYSPLDAMAYLKMTKNWVQTFSEGAWGRKTET